MGAFRFPHVLLGGALLFTSHLPSRADAAKAETTPERPVQTSGPDFRTEVEKRTFELVNDYRKEHDLAPLAWSDAAAKLAREHSKEMAGGDVDFGHDGFGDRVRKLKEQMTGFHGAGENVLMTSDPHEVARNAVTTWLHSPHHLANIRGDYNYSGLGVWQNPDGVIYFTQFFVKVVPPSPS